MDIGYMQAYDIDWFAKSKSFYLHFASNGSEFPIDLEREDILYMQDQVAQIKEEREPRINEQYLYRLLESGRLEATTPERYLASFKIFASKGFYSFDYDYEERKYMLVAGPGKSIENEMLGKLKLPFLEDYKEWEKDCIAQIREFNR